MEANLHCISLNQRFILMRSLLISYFGSSMEIPKCHSPPRKKYPRAEKKCKEITSLGINWVVVHLSPKTQVNDCNKQVTFNKQTSIKRPEVTFGTIYNSYTRFCYHHVTTFYSPNSLMINHICNWHPFLWKTIDELMYDWRRLKNCYLFLTFGFLGESQCNKCLWKKLWREFSYHTVKGNIEII